MESGKTDGHRARLVSLFVLLQGDESHKADEYIRFIKDRLPDAVMQCIKAAGEEFIPKIQQSLLMVCNMNSFNY